MLEEVTHVDYDDPDEDELGDDRDTGQVVVLYPEMITSTAAALRDRLDEVEAERQALQDELSQLRAERDALLARARQDEQALADAGLAHRDAVAALEQRHRDELQRLHERAVRSLTLQWLALSTS